MAGPKTSPRKAPPPAATVPVLEQWLELGRSESTGILHSTLGEGLSAETFFMGGALVGCVRSDDGHRLADYLVASGAVSPAQVGQFAHRLQGGEDLADLLVLEAGASPESIIEARRILFDDNVHDLATGGPGLFEAQDMVFPPNMQLGVDLIALVRAVSAWRVRIEPVLQNVGSDEQWVLAGMTLEPLAPNVAALLGEPHALIEVIAVFGLPRHRGLDMVGRLLTEGTLVPYKQVHPEPPSAPPPTDYEKAAQGGFVKSYEVLDKVDLSGSFSGPHHQDVQTFGAVEAVELGGEGDDEGVDLLGGPDDLDDVEDLDEHALSRELGLSSATMETNDDMDVFERGGRADPAEDDAEHEPADDEEDLVVRVESDDSIEAVDVRSTMAAQQLEEDSVGDVAVMDDGDSVEFVPEGATSTLGRDKLNALHERIDIFNHIFRILFRTFSRHAGESIARERFDGALETGRGQYPDLLRNLRVEPDGSLRPSTLINNLDTLPVEDHAGMVNQGLYELIFSHIYAAKEILTPDAEAAMMEQILVFEQQLQAG